MTIITCIQRHQKGIIHTIKLKCNICLFQIAVIRCPRKHSHTKDVKNESGPCLHGTHDEVGTTKHNWSAQCQCNVTWWVSMVVYDMLSQ